MKTIAFPRCSQWSSPSLFRDRRGKEKRQKIQQKEGKTKAATTLSEADSSNSQQIPLAGRESLSEKQNELQLESLNLESVQENVSHKKEKNKKVPIIPTLTKSISGDNTYICTVCERTFRRAAALCWHMKYDHKSKEDDSDNSESSENESMREELAARDEDFNVKTETEGRDDQQFEVLTGQEIHVILENCQDQGRKKKEDTKKTHRVKKKVGKHLQEDNNSPRDKPYTCNMCGREFKELTVLKAHGLVHSDERKYKCEFENCPYGFKTKGGLVRHMRRHTGERPYACKRCGRTFSASGTLTRHMKALRNCSETPNSAYPSYMKKRAYHPNIPAVIDPEQRGARRGRSILPQPQASVQEEDRDIHYIITDTAGPDTVEADVVDPDAAGVEGMEPGTVVADTIGSQLVSEGDSVAEIKQEKNDTEEWSTETGEVEENSDVNTMAGTEMGSSVIKTQESALLIQRHDSTSISSSGQHTFTCNICGKEFKALAILKAHGLVHSDERKYKCEFENCPHGFKRKSGLVRHMRRHTGERPYKCKRCGRTFSESGACTRHMKARRGCSKTPDSAYPGYMKNWTYHPNIPAVIDPNGLRGRSTLPQPQASVQGVTVVQHEEGDIHYIITDTAGPDTVEADVVDPDTAGVERIEPGMVVTDVVGSQLVSEGGSVAEIKQNKGGDTEDIEASVLAMEEEEGSTTKPGALQNRKSVLRDALVAVKQLYSLKKNKGPSEISKPGPSATGSLQCMVCNRFFRGSSYLRQHMRTHTGDRPYQCQHCNRSFTTRSNLKRHMYVHKKQRDFKCGECGKLFKCLAHVQQHLKIHSQEHSFKCIVCEKLFKTQNSLKIHLRTHSGVNPYKCQVCSRHFPESGSLQRHMRLHTGEKPYKCPRCHRGFAEKATMTRHLKAKMRCSSTRDATNVDMNQSINTTMLAQFSSMGADTQQYILPEADGGHQYIMPAVQDQEMNENYVVLQTTGDGSEEVSENLEVNKQEEKVSSSGSDAQETHEIVDPSTGESLIIVASKSVVDLVRNLQPSLESDECGSSLQKIKDILFAAGGGYITTATSFEQEESVGVEELSTAPEKENIKEETEVLEK